LVILTTLIIFLGITFYQIVAAFLLPLFLAAVTAVWCQPLYGYFLKKLRQRDRWAAAATTGTVCLILFVPLVIGVFSATMQLRRLTETGKSIALSIMEMVQQKELTEADLRVQVREGVGKVLDFLMPPPAVGTSAEEIAQFRADRQKLAEQWEQEALEASRNAGTYLQELAKKSLGMAASGSVGLASKTIDLIGAVVGGLIQLTMFLIALYYFLCDGSSLLSASENLIPVQVDYQRQLVHEFNRVVQAVVSATMLAAIAQGATTAILLFVVGFHSIFLLFVVATCASLIPIAGAWIVWGPFAAWLAYQGSWGSAIFVTGVGVVVIGTMDNIIKAYVLQNDTSLHPLLAFVSVFGGMQAMGLWGIFVGPIVACCLHALVRIFNTELGEFSKERFAKKPPALESSSHTSEAPATPNSALPADVPSTATPAHG
jgi:predicted PurR-regulated permease PerM